MATIVIPREVIENPLPPGEAVRRWCEEQLAEDRRAMEWYRTQVLGLPASGEERGMKDQEKLELIRWITRTHRRLLYETLSHQAGGRKLAMELISELSGPEGPPPDGVDPLKTWTLSSDGVCTRLSDGATFQIGSVEDWLGASWWSTSARNNQPLPGKMPGSVLQIGPGDQYTFGRWTLHTDIWLDNLKLNPTRLGDRVGYPNTPFTYLAMEPAAPGGWKIIYGLNNRDQLKGIWQNPTPALQNPDEPPYPAWFQFGHDEQTIVKGALNSDGSHATIFRSNLYFERASAATLQDLLFLGPGTSKGIFQTENPKARDADGNPTWGNWPEDPDAVGGEWQAWRNLHYLNVGVDGQWNAETNSHPPGVGSSKWGYHTNRVGLTRDPSEIGFLWDGGFVKGIAGEHCFYHHNPRALNDDDIAIWIRNAILKWARRTAVQVVCRSGEGPAGKGQIILENLDIEDVCLEQGGGGSALTFSGRFEGKVDIDRVKVRLGCNPNLAPSEQGNITGAFVSWGGSGSDGIKTRRIHIHDCDFEVGEHFQGVGAARRPNVQAGFCEVLEFGPNNRVYNHPGTREAFDDKQDNDLLILHRNNVVIGDVRMNGNKFTDPNLDGSAWQAALDSVEAVPGYQVV